MEAGGLDRSVAELPREKYPSRTWGAEDMNGMIMNGIMMYVIWLVGPVLQIILLIFMIQRRLHVVFPRFFSYIVFQVVISGVLFGIYRFYHQNNFDAYCTSNSINVLLSDTENDETLHHLIYH